MNEPLLTIKELAGVLRRPRSYVHAMKKRGFMMPGGLATVSEARAWLIRNPSPRSKETASTRPLQKLS